MATLTIVSLCVFLVTGTLASDDKSKFAPYGSAVGDQSAYPSYDLLFSYKTNGKEGTDISITNSYAYTIGGYFDIFYGGSGSYKYDDTSNIWMRATTDASLLSEYNNKVKVQNPSFVGVRAAVITWDNTYDSEGKTNSFQVVLIVAADLESWAFFNFGTLQFGSAQSGAWYNYRDGSGTTAIQGIKNYYFRADLTGTVQYYPKPAVCGNGIVETGEQCDSNTPCCQSCQFASSSVVCRPAVDSCDLPESCTGSTGSCPSDQLSNTVKCFCARQNITPGAQGYYCNTAGGFYQCMSGAWAANSRNMTCSPGLTCGCSFGQECSCSGSRSPCVYPSQVGAACPK